MVHFGGAGDVARKRVISCGKTQAWFRTNLENGLPRHIQRRLPRLAPCSSMNCNPGAAALSAHPLCFGGVI